MALLKRESLPPASPQDSFSALGGWSDSLPGKDAPAGFPESWGYVRDEAVLINVAGSKGAYVTQLVRDADRGEGRSQHPNFSESF